VTNVGERDRIDIVAHSFGTHLVAWALLGIPETRRPRIHTIVFAASVFKPGFPWRDLVGHGVRRVINDCGINDWVLPMSQLFALFTGMAGREGFSGMTGEDFRNRFFRIGHSGYFVSNGVSDDSFMKSHWLPALLSDDRVAPAGDPRSRTAIRGVVTFLANNAEPIKILCYVLPLLVGIGWIDQQRREAISQRELAVARQLAVQSESLRTKPGNPTDVSVLLGIESLRRAPLSDADSEIRPSETLLKKL
jgi:hypothetical protein